MKITHLKIANLSQTNALPQYCHIKKGTTRVPCYDIYFT